MKNVCKIFVCFGFTERVSLCSLGCRGTHSVYYAGIELRVLPTSTYEVLRLKSSSHHLQTQIFLKDIIILMSSDKITFRISKQHHNLLFAKSEFFQGLYKYFPKGKEFTLDVFLFCFYLK